MLNPALFFFFFGPDSVPTNQCQAWVTILISTEGRHVKGVGYERRIRPFISSVKMER